MSLFPRTPRRRRGRRPSVHPPVAVGGDGRGAERGHVECGDRWEHRGHDGDRAGVRRGVAGGDGGRHRHAVGAGVGEGVCDGLTARGRGVAERPRDAGRRIDLGRPAPPRSSRAPGGRGRRDRHVAQGRSCRVEQAHLGEIFAALTVKPTAPSPLLSIAALSPTRRSRRWGSRSVRRERLPGLAERASGRTHAAKALCSARCRSRPACRRRDPRRCWEHHDTKARSEAVEKAPDGVPAAYWTTSSRVHMTPRIPAPSSAT